MRHDGVVVVWSYSRRRIGSPHLRPGLTRVSCLDFCIRPVLPCSVCVFFYKAYPADLSLHGLMGVAHRYNIVGLHPDSSDDKSLLERQGGASGGAQAATAQSSHSSMSGGGAMSRQGIASRTHVPHFLSRLSRLLPRRAELACPMQDVDYVMRMIAGIPMPSRPADRAAQGAPMGGGGEKRGSSGDASKGGQQAAYQRPTSDVYSQRTKRRRDDE